MNMSPKKLNLENNLKAEYTVMPKEILNSTMEVTAQKQWTG